MSYLLSVRYSVSFCNQIGYFRILSNPFVLWALQEVVLHNNLLNCISACEQHISRTYSLKYIKTLPSDLVDYEAHQREQCLHIF